MGVSIGGVTFGGCPSKQSYWGVRRGGPNEGSHLGGAIRGVELRGCRWGGSPLGGVPMWGAHLGGVVFGGAGPPHPNQSPVPPSPVCLGGCPLRRDPEPAVGEAPASPVSPLDMTLPPPAPRAPHGPFLHPKGKVRGGGSPKCGGPLEGGAVSVPGPGGGLSCEWGGP